MSLWRPSTILVYTALCCTSEQLTQRLDWLYSPDVAQSSLNIRQHLIALFEARELFEELNILLKSPGTL